MSRHTLAHLFNECVLALERGDASSALALLRDIDPDTLSSAAARLHSTLRARALLRMRDAEAAGPLSFDNDLQGSEPTSLLEWDKRPLRQGVSLVTACMNREANLLKVLPSWLATGADEIVVVDWSSTSPLWPQLERFDDPRLRVVRIEGEPRWILTHAFNVALRMARYQQVYKLDADIQIGPDFLQANGFGKGEFVRGFWRTAIDAGEADQRFTNGTFGAHKEDLRKVGYYNERILTYGWDDTDLYARLAASEGLAGRLIAGSSLRHLHQDEHQRLENQDVPAHTFYGEFLPTENENQTNRFAASMQPEWASYWPQQDYILARAKYRLWSGTRKTVLPQISSAERCLASTLSARLLSIWSNRCVPKQASHLAHDLEFARLVRQAQQQGLFEQLASSIQSGNGLHFFSAPSGPLRNSALKTLRVIRQHAAASALPLLVLEDDGLCPETEAQACDGVLRIGSRLLITLVEMYGATRVSALHDMEAALRADIAGCRFWNLDAQGLASAALAKADQITDQLSPTFVPAEMPSERAAFVTSVYDEGNLMRLVEYLACVVLNLRAFSQVLLFTEVKDGLFQLVIQALSGLLDLPPRRLVLIPYVHRPTFEQLFMAQQWVPHGTLLAVGNADVAFDGTLHVLASHATANDVYAISRWDIRSDGRHAQLIRLENGTPNTFSADAWVALTPFTPDFHLDYPIGSFHCDSFINNQVGRSKTYRLLNPCLDVHVFHLHDERFNSSAEKAVRDQKEIERRYGIERARNGNEDPLRGAPWTLASTDRALAGRIEPVTWKPSALVLDWASRPVNLAGLVWLHLLWQAACENHLASLVVRIRPQDLTGPPGRLLQHYRRHSGAHHLHFMLDDAPRPAARGKPGSVIVEFIDSAPLLLTLAQQGEKAFREALAKATPGPAASEGESLTSYWFEGDLDTTATCGLLELLQRQMPQRLSEIQTFLDSLPAWSPEKLMVRPFAADLAVPAVQPAVHARKPRVSLVTSLFRGGDFLAGYLENVTAAAIAADGEVILVDANCDDSETPAIRRHIANLGPWRDRFRYIQLDKDPGLYACWRVAIEHARGDYISNANLDDRRSPAHTARLADLLDRSPELAAACGSISAVMEPAPGSWFELLPNQVWFEDLGHRTFGYEDLFATNEDGTIRSRNILHCMPLWRRSLHQRFGWFDEEKYGTSADWAFWLHCARDGARFGLDVDAFGRYYLNPQSHNRRHDADGAKERRIIADYIGVVQHTILKQ